MYIIYLLVVYECLKYVDKKMYIVLKFRKKDLDCFKCKFIENFMIKSIFCVENN